MLAGKRREIFSKSRTASIKTLSYIYSASSTKMNQQAKS